MSYHIESGESVEHAVRRIAVTQLDHALAALEAADDKFDTAVHEVRRRCKRLRAVMRLVRASMAEFDEREHWLRDTAALLSHTRDAAVLQGTHRRVESRAGSDLDTSAIAAKLGLDERREAPIPDTHQATLAEVKARLEAARASVSHWHLDDDGFSAMRAGLLQTYARSKRAMGRARRTQSPPDCHRWRKRVKYHAFHMQILREVWPEAIRARETAATELGELLGAAHDFANYRAALDALRAAGCSARALTELARVATELENGALARSWPIGRRLFALTPATFVSEIEACWDAWRHP